MVIYLPVVVGGVLFSRGIINLYSSLLFFCGGYIAIKNTFDYRKVKKNIRKSKDNQKNMINNNDKKNDDTFKLGNHIFFTNDRKISKNNVKVRKRTK